MAVVTTRELTQAVVTCWPNFTPSQTECAIEFMEKVLDALRETARSPNVSDEIAFDSGDDFNDDDNILRHCRQSGDEIPLAGFTMKSMSDCVFAVGRTKLIQL